MKTILVSGASEMGEAIARRLILTGCSVLVGGADRKRLDETCARLGPRASGVQLDATDLASVQAAVESLASNRASIDGLVNAWSGADGAAVGPFTELDRTHWRPTIDAHLRSVLNCCHAVIPQMSAKGGTIVSVVASEALRGAPASAVFSAANAGAIVFTETMVAECQPLGIRINCVLTNLRDERSRDPGQSWTDDLSKAVQFLLSEEASGVTGACLDATNGWALH